jgi:hypothetical protein
MTRTRRTTMPTVPLAERIRAALTQGWHTLAALDDLTGLRGSKARAAVHEALRTIKASGAIVEEQSTSCGVAVRIVETAAGMPEDESGKWEPASDGATACNRSPCPDPCPGRGCECRAAQGFAFSSDDWCNCACHYGVTIETTVHVAVKPIPDNAHAVYEAIKAAGPVRVVAEDGSPGNAGTEPAYAAEPDAATEAARLAPREPGQADAPPAERKQCPSVWHGIRCEREEGHPCNEDGHHETKDRSIAIWTTDAADRWAAGEAERKAAAEPGPSSHCAVCEVVYAQHGADRGHPFAPKPRGRPRAKPIPNAAPAILPRAKQRKTPGPIVDVDGGRIERAGDAEPRLPKRCHPPACHADDIHDPARVRHFERPLCEAHRAWVERAGGSVAR